MIIIMLQINAFDLKPIIGNNSNSDLFSFLPILLKKSYVISPYLPDGSVCWMFATAGINVGRFYNIGT